MKRRFILYSGSLLVSVGLLLLPGILLNPYRNISAASRSVVTTNGAVGRTFSSYYHRYTSGYILVFHTGDDPQFSPAEYVTISRINKKLVVELINGAGVENAVRLENNDAVQYIKDHHIDLSSFEQTGNEE